MSTHSFNALLKTLEEPPPHIKFLLATTDPQKLPVTILSRCLQYNLKRLVVDQIQQQLVHILDQEKVKYETGACAAIARAADGSMRDGLSLLDQAIAYCDFNLREKDVHDMLGTIKQSYLHKILIALSNMDAPLLMQLVAQIAERAPDFNQVLAGLISLLHRVALVQQAPDSLDDWVEDRDQLFELSRLLKPEDVQLYYQIAVNGCRDLNWLPDQKSGVEMLLLRMLAFRPVESGMRLAQAATPAASATNVQNTVSATAVQSPVSEKSKPSSEPKNPAKKTPVSKSPATKTQAPKAQAPEKPVTISDSADWNEMIKAMQLAGPVRQLAAHCSFEGIQDDRFKLVLEPKYEQICGQDMQQRLEQAIQNTYGKNLVLKMNFGSSTIESPVGEINRKSSEKHNEAVESIKQDSTVQEIQNMFDAQVSPDLIRPNE